ncbi:MAG: hypothetical protein GX677_09690 [Treponema sp.]|jgi:hypothetical protein|nr:hypothetical protein [Treponema sp.]
MIDKWSMFVDEMILTFAPELIEKTSIYKNNGPLFLYMEMDHILFGKTDYILEHNTLKFHASIFDEDDRIELPARAIQFSTKITDENIANMEVYKWWKKN